MLTKESLDQRRAKKIALLNEKRNKKISDFENKNNQKCEEKLSSYKNDELNDVQLQIYKANRKQEYIHQNELFAFKQDKKLKSKINHLEKKDKRHLARLNRIFEVDLLRGVIIIGMIIDHLVFDFAWGVFSNGGVFVFPEGTALYNIMFKLSIFCGGYWGGDFRITLRILGVVLLAFLCGISSSLSKNNIKRGILLVVAGTIMTIVMNFLGKHILQDSTFVMLISTLTTLGMCILIVNGFKLLFIFIESRFNKKSFSEQKKKTSWKWVALVTTISIFAFWFFLRNAGLPEYNSLGRTLLKPYNGPGAVTGEHLYDNYFGKDTWLNFFSTRHENNYFMNFFHLFNNEGNYCEYEYTELSKLTFGDVIAYFVGAKGYGIDWLGLFPMVGYTFLGSLIGDILYKDKKSIIYFFFNKNNRNADDPLTTTPGKINAILNNVFSFVTVPGQYTVWIYILHQPVIMGVVGLILLMLGGTLVL